MSATTRQNLPLLELDMLRTLVAIADSGSFSIAAKDIGRTPSAVSMQVKKVEELLGTPVFLRDSRSVSLTPDGAYIVDHGRQMLALNRTAMERFFQPGLTGIVRLGAPDNVAERFLPEMLRRFSHSHPGVTVDVTVESTRHLVTELRAGRLELTILTCQGEIDREPGVEIVLTERLVWAARRGGCAPSRTPLPLSVWQEGCAWRDAGLEGLSKQGRSWRIAFQSAHISGQRAAILADLAVAPIPVTSLNGQIVEVPAKYEMPALPPYWLGLLVTENPDPATAAAASYLREAFAAAQSRLIAEASAPAMSTAEPLSSSVGIAGNAD